MEADLQGIKRILEIYLARSATALEALAAEDWDGFDSAMRWRTAAFHNFRAADYLVQLKHSDYLSAPEWRELGQSLQEADRLLQAAIDRQKERLNQRLIKISRHKTGIGKFHSGVQEQAGFQKTV